MIVAIDGPVGAGKSTVARGVAERIGAAYLDTGAMYRAAALAALSAGCDPDDPDAVAAASRAADIDLVPAGDGLRVLLDGRDVTAAIRQPEVSRLASRVAAHPPVRQVLVARQQAIMARGTWVADGRDIGTVVAPGAELKVFLTAEVGERARRRHAELAARGDPQSIDEVLADIAARDERDRSRDVGPLAVAEDAVIVDTTGKSIEEVIEVIETLARERVR